MKISKDLAEKLNNALPVHNPLKLEEGRINMRNLQLKEGRVQQNGTVFIYNSRSPITITRTVESYEIRVSDKGGFEMIIPAYYNWDSDENGIYLDQSNRRLRIDKIS